MDRALSALCNQRDQAARDLLAIEGWPCSRAAVAWAIEAMLANSPQSTAALGWLLKQMQHLPDQEEATAKIADLTLAIANISETTLAENVVNFRSAPP